MALTRFDRTLFLDADTLVLGPLDDLFDIALRFDLAMAHDVRRASRLIREGSVPTPYAFPQLNSGVVLFRRSPAALAFLARWAARFRETGATRDQTVLKDLLWEDETIRFHVLPPEFNLRRLPLLDAWEPLDARPTILHSHRLLDHLRGKGPRLTDPLVLLAEERRMLAEEWRAAEAAGAGGDAIGRFRSAQRALGEE
nr:putative nucleotide-diphospho-sugar transferase [Rubellimicrobium sp. CFH 75288]